MSSESEIVMKEKFQNGDIGLSELNGNNPDGEMENDDASPKSDRVYRKAKRFHRQSSGSGATTVENGPVVQTEAAVLRKNSRKSRDGRGRGLPKKGGAGGKGTWGAPGDELFEDGHCRDAKDPNYDSESEDEYVVEEIKPDVTDEELRKILEPIILEYLNHGDTAEVQDSLAELNLKKKYRVLELVINVALDHKAAHREMISVLISDLYGKILFSDDITQGFDFVLKNMADLTIDTPDAPVVVGQFIARAVADDCLAPKFIHRYEGNVDCDNTQAALDKAELLLSRKHGIVRLDNIWGTGGGIRPVKYLIKQIVLLLKEYLSSGDIAEATRCLQELEVPHFHHELVYEAVMMVIEDTSERAAHRMCDFLKSLSETVVITPEQMSQGFRRIYEGLPDITLDVPNAYSLLERFATMCHRDGVISPDLFKEMPQRGRKRFVSEGDGGRVKEVTLHEINLN